MSVNPSIKEHAIKHSLIVVVVATVFSLLIAGAVFFFSKNNLIAGMALLVLPFPVIIVYKFLANPRIAFISVLFANYFAIGLSRYIPAPVGLSVDALLFFTLLSVFFSQFNRKIEWSNAARDYTWIALFWFGMTLFQLINPEAVSREAWFYAMRGQALYLVMIIPLVYLIFNRPKDFDLLIKLTAWFTVAAVVKALMQKYIGVDQWEQRWLNQPGNRTTHLLFGQLRVFSFFSDAGTFGSSMGYAGVVFSILGIYEKRKKQKLLWFTIALGAFFAMMISGTRSAIAVPLAGFMLYTVLSKQVKIMITVGTVVLLLFVFLKYTTIGQGNYDIRRMRSAFNNEDASLNVRQENRKLFAEYLKTRPFGGGIGSSGNWGLRFSPNTFLAQTATDGWYVQLWAEQGIVGLTFYLLMIFYFFLKSIFLIFFRLKKPENIHKAIAFVSGMSGLMVTSYSASSLGQMPNTILVMASIALISLMPQWEKEEAEISDENKKAVQIS
jgi:hypothetical protein